jgi:hypothetical protein
MRGAFATQRWFLWNQAHIFMKANQHMKELLTTIACLGVLPECEPLLPYGGKPYREPSCAVSLSYLARRLLRVLQERYQSRIRRLRMNWSVSVLHSNWREAVLWKAAALTAPAGRFWADPFLIEEDGRTYCFVEEYVYEAGKAHIVALEITSEGVITLGTALSEPFHLSFPFLFKYNGSLYMCPEASGSHQIRVYRCTGFPLEWEHAATLMDDVWAVDSMLFEHGGKWWMLTNIDRSGSENCDSELYLFSSDSPLSAQWAPHPKNPLMIDPEGGRNGGLILEPDAIYRLGQKHGFANYGESLRIYRIAELTDTVYLESHVLDLHRDFSSRTLGIHHLSTTGKVTVFDQKTYETIE